MLASGCSSGGGSGSAGSGSGSGSNSGGAAGSAGGDKGRYCADARNLVAFSNEYVKEIGSGTGNLQGYVVSQVTYVAHTLTAMAIVAPDAVKASTQASAAAWTAADQAYASVDYKIVPETAAQAQALPQAISAAAHALSAAHAQEVQMFSYIQTECGATLSFG